MWAPFEHTPSKLNASVEYPLHFFQISCQTGT
jgi:hypothetical protein